MRPKIYELDPACFFTVPGLAWKTASKETKLELDLLTDVDIYSTDTYIDIYL